MTNSSPSCFTPVEANVISLFTSTSKKSALRRCASRSGDPVLTEASCTATEAVEPLGLAASMTMVPATSSNAPRTLVTMAWRAMKPRRVWLGSMVQVPLYSL